MQLAWGRSIDQKALENKMFDVIGYNISLTAMILYLADLYMDHEIQYACRRRPHA